MTGPRYVGALDGVRALSVLAVIGVHLNLSFTPGGGIGVIVFFVLSGFLITSLLLEERARNGAINFRFFYARRGLRLLPALFTVLVAATIVALTQRPSALSHSTLHFVPAALFYVGNWVRAASPNFVGGTLAHTWSLSVEEQFYLLWPLLLVVLLARGASLRTIALVALGGALASDAGKLIDWVGGTVSANANRMYGTDLSGDALMLGCALAVLMRTDRDRVERVVRVAAPAAVIYLLVAVTLIHPLVGSFAADRAYEVIAWPLVSAAAALLIGHLVLRGGSPGAGFLRLPPLRYVGRISYGLYLWHYPIIIWMAVWFGWSFDPAAWQVGIDLAITFAVAITSYHLLERPLLRLKPRAVAAPALTGRP